MKNNLYNYILGIADNSLILGQRLEFIDFIVAGF
jgi:hypothetical protein